MLRLLALAVFMMGFTQEPIKKIRIFLAGDSTIAIKEIRAYPETGWGMPFEYFWDSTVAVVNRAKNGRSTKSFINEGLWNSIYKEATEGDYVFIQFGHNDEAKEKLERYATPDTFKMNLTRFVKETRERKAIPVLITPVARRRFDKEGKIVESHAEYSALTREVAKEQGVILFDLDEKSMALYQQFGMEGSRSLFLQLKPGEHPNYPDGKEDNTHFNELGARLIAQIVLKDIREQIPELYSRVRIPQKK